MSIAHHFLASMDVRRSIWALLTAGALALGSLAWTQNLERACTLGQWPVLPSCARQAADAPAQQAKSLRERIARNPGDSGAWIELAVLSIAPANAPGVNHANALDTATRLAGEDRRVQRMQAVQALERGQWPQAVGWLVRLVQDSQDSAAAVTLAALLKEPQALAAMKNHLQPGTRWLGPLIAAMPQAGVPVIWVMPLVVQALPRQGLSPEVVQQLLVQLKANGQWLEAHALWTAALGHPVPQLFNGDFDQGFIDGGFDWEVAPVPPSKAGAVVRQVAVATHGGVLQVEFTGRPVAAPLVRQHLLLLHPRYVLSGQFSTLKLRTDGGLAWTLQCVASQQEIARTPALKDTGGQWKPFSVGFDMPPSCGQAVALQLQTFVPSEALAGLRGTAEFDNFKLETRP